MRFLSIVTILGCTAFSFQSCDSASDKPADNNTEIESNKPAMLSATAPDLRLFELQGDVRECQRTVFYNVKVVDDNPVVDTAKVNTRTTELYFDELGNYVTTDSELVKRDDKGRITYWRDRRPNSKGVNPGFLRDTLSYKYVNHNLVESSGMGEFAVTVYDNRSRVVGQYSEPAIDGTVMSAFNVYLKEDDKGNWTERLTVWTSKTPSGRPHVNYTLERREIKYY